MAVRSFYTTRASGGIKRINDLTAPSVDATIPTGTGNPGAMYDLKIFPGNPNKVVAVGNINAAVGSSGIFYSTNGGVSWNVPLGTHITLRTLKMTKVFVYDSSTVYVCGENCYVSKSTDGGFTFDLLTVLPTPSGTFNADYTANGLFFVTANIGFVKVLRESTGEVFLYKTINGGTSWTALNGGAFLTNTDSVGTIGGINYNVHGGVWASADQTTILVLTKSGVYKSIDSGATFTLKLDLYTTWTLPYGTVISVFGNTVWAGGYGELLYRSPDLGETWVTLNAFSSGARATEALFFHTANTGLYNRHVINSSMYLTIDAGDNESVLLTDSSPISSVHTMEISTCYELTSCDEEAYPSLQNVNGAEGVDLGTVDGLVINATITSTGEDPVTFNGCYTVSVQQSFCNDTPGMNYIVDSYTEIGDCGDFEISSVCPFQVNPTVIGNTETFQVEVTNNSAEDQSFSFSLTSCATSGLDIVTPSPVIIPAGATALIDMEYTPTAVEEGSCQLVVEGPCTTQTCNICYRGINVPACPHFNICITGPTCAPDCIKPGDVISFNLGGTITPSAYPTTVTFSVINQVTNQTVFTQTYPVEDDTDLDAILINLFAGDPGKYCAEVCIPGCNTKRVLCFDVCQPFDIYKDKCNHWHVHRPTKCMVEEFVVSVYEFGDKTHPIVNDVIWDISQDNTFEFEVPGDGIYVFEMKDPETGEVMYSFSAFETCGIQECFKILMDKIMCSCSDPCCKKCDGSVKEHREFARMTLNQLMPLYFTYLGMARRNELYTDGMQLISDDQMSFLHDASKTLEKIRDIIMDCGCLCPEQKNTATNRGGCSTC